MSTETTRQRGTQTTVGSAKARNRQAGESSEADIIQLVDGLSPVPDTTAWHYDAVATERISTADIPISGALFVDRGRRIEIKSTIARYADGRRGKFYFRPAQHDYLESIGGMYVLTVCEPTPTRDIIAAKLVPASAITESIGEVWVSAPEDRSDYSQRSWSNFFTTDSVEDTR